MRAQDLTALDVEVADYLRFKRKRLTTASQRDYKATLQRLARYYPDLRLEDFEPPAGTRLVEDFLTACWGGRAPRTYNKNLSVVRDFFLWQARRGTLHGDPTLSIERARPRAIHRTTLTGGQRAAIMAANPDLRDRLALRLLLDYGIRKGALQRVRLEHFDRARHRLVIFTKGDRVHQVPIPDPAFWDDLDELAGEPGSLPGHFLLPWHRTSTRRAARTLTSALDDRLEETIAETRALGPGGRKAAERLREARAMLAAATETSVRRDPTRQIGEHGLHDWWYRALSRAGIVPAGASAGLRMHTARHTAGQRVLDATGNLKAVQKLLGHASIRTTADSYTDWDLEQLADTMREVIATG